MNCDKIKAMIAKGAKLIDVRSIHEFAQNRIQGAKNIPMESLQDIQNIASRDDDILLYCRSGARSGMAESMLTQNGYNAINIGSINTYIGCLEQ